MVSQNDTLPWVQLNPKVNVGWSLAIVAMTTSGLITKKIITDYLHSKSMGRSTIMDHAHMFLFNSMRRLLLSYSLMSLLKEVLILNIAREAIGHILDVVMQMASSTVTASALIDLIVQFMMAMRSGSVLSIEWEDAKIARLVRWTTLSFLLLSAVIMKALGVNSLIYYAWIGQPETYQMNAMFIFRMILAGSTVCCGIIFRIILMVKFNNGDRMPSTQVMSNKVLLTALVSVVIMVVVRKWSHPDLIGRP